MTLDDLRFTTISPDELREAMRALGLNARGLARNLGLGENGDRLVQRWIGGKQAPGPTTVVAIRLWLALEGKGPRPQLDTRRGRKIVDFD